jgi:tetratricopeptide (TPR) repeat protein
VDALEALAGDRVSEQVERLAHHALRGEVWDKALAYCRQAGAKAATQSAHREAVALYEQALVALEHLPESRATCEQAFDLRLDLRYSLIPLGELGRVLDYLHEAEPLAEALGDQRKLAWLSHSMANCLWWVADHSRAIEFGQRALALAATLDDFALRVLATFHLGQAYNALGDYRRAIDFLRRAIDFLGTNVTTLEGDPVRGHLGSTAFPSVLSHAWLSRCLAEVGEFTAGSAHGEEGVRVAEAVDHPFSLAIAAWGIGLLSLRQGDPTKALPVLEHSLEGCQLWHLPSLFPWVASTLGYAYALSVQMTEALPLLEQSVDQAASRGILADQSLRVAWLSEAYLLASRLDEAIVYAGRALDLSRTHRERGNEAWILRLLGEIAVQREPPDLAQAEAQYQQALALAEALGMRPLQAHCHFSLGTLYAATGQRERARTALSTAIALYRDMDMTFWLPQAETALAQVQ